ncbi:FAD-dependent oxidoreductase [Microbacterium sp.]|jgi:glycine/D-amino acid oxidase-like deaminating enzyme/Rieske Fe-S protein|uniref:FAD-dependent oxidoreductase n=1 Tax=Microbacterium sp. TaxID=51671 RepID=UPI0037C65893
MPPLWKLDRTTPSLSVPFAPARHEVVIVGAGITGLSTGLMLAALGQDVAIVEAGEIAELATGSNTGKVSLLQGSTLSTLRRHHPASLVRAYVDANRAGAEWLTEFAGSAGVPTTTRTAFSYTPSRSGVEAVEAEIEAGREAGLDMRRADEAELATPFPAMAAAALDGQLAIDPVALADALARAFVAAGGTLHTGTRVRSVHAVPEPLVRTDAGALRADRIVLATGTAIMDRGLTFAKTRGLRSHCVAFDYDGDIPDGMFLSIDGPARSVRSVTADDGPAGAARLIVGGNGHPVGRSHSDAAEIDELVAWAQKNFPGAREVARWSAQDYESHNLVPFVGVMPRTLGRVRFATGYAKWGLTNGPAAAIRLTSEIMRVPFRERPSWMIALGTRLTVPADLARGARENALVGAEAAKGWLRAESAGVPVLRPGEGEGVIAQRAGHPVAVSSVDGQTRAVSAVCPHLGGVVSWNDADRTWDCPLHASRFAPDGTRIEGPAVDDLTPLDGPSDAPANEAPRGCPASAVRTTP